MRIKKFTLMLMAVLFSVTGFAQKSFPVGKDIAFNRQAKVQMQVKKDKIGTSFAMQQKNRPTQAANKVRAKAPEVVTPPEAGEVEYYTLTATNHLGNPVTRTVQLVWDDEDDDILYVSGLSYYIPDAFVKGTFVSEDKVVFEKGQYMGDYSGYEIYFVGYDSEGVAEDVEAIYDAGEATFTFNTLISDNSDPSGGNKYAYLTNVVLTPSQDGPEIPVVIPSDLEKETYAFSAYDYFADNAEVSGNLNIGIYGSDVYIQGFSVDYPEAWVKGSFVDETTIEFPSGQLLTDKGRPYFVAIDENFDIVDSYTLIYDPATGAFEEGSELFIINTYKDKIQQSVWQLRFGYEIKKITEKAATPKNSTVSSIKYMVTGDDVLEFTLAKVDEDGDGLLVDKLYYKVWYQGQDATPVAYTFTPDDYATLTESMTEVPATFTDGVDILDGKLTLRMKDYTTWKSIGIQGIYYGGDERHESEITWYSPTWPTMTELPDGAEVTEHTLKGQTYSGAAVERTVGLAFVGDDMYIRGLGSTDEDAWVKGTKNQDGDYVFPCGQDMGVYDDEDRLFLMGYTDEGVTDVVLKVNAADGVYEFTTGFLENADYTDKLYYVEWVDAGATITIAEAEEEIPTPVEVPEGLETEAYAFTGYAYFDKAEVVKNVTVGFDGNDVYLQGLSDYLPKAWVKGTIDGTQVTFETGQYLGQYDEEYDLWLIGYTNGTGVCNYVMEYDAETRTLSNSSTDELVGTTQKKNNLELWDLFCSVEIKKITEKAAKPANPTVSTMRFSAHGDMVVFNVPLVDENGDALVADKLSYKLFYDNGSGEEQAVTLTTDLYEKLTEDMTEIPYGFTDEYDIYDGAIYLNMDHSSWTRIGIQSIYAGGGEIKSSEIGWYTIIWPQVIELPEGAEVSNYKYTVTTNDGETEMSAKVAMVGDDVYVQGLSAINEEAWIKGTRDPETNVYTFVNGQYLGVYMDELTESYYNIFLIGYHALLGVTNAQMTYDPETRTFTSNTFIIENVDYVDMYNPLNGYRTGLQLVPESDVAVSAVNAELGESGVRYNLAGQRVDKNFKGIFIENGKKYLKK